MTRGFEFAPEREVIVNFSVENHTDFTARIPHRLRAAFDIDDRQASVPEKDTEPWIAPAPFAIGTAVRHGPNHVAKCYLSANADEPRKSTHCDQFRSGKLYSLRTR